MYIFCISSAGSRSRARPHRICQPRVRAVTFGGRPNRDALGPNWMDTSAALSMSISQNRIVLSARLPCSSGGSRPMRRPRPRRHPWKRAVMPQLRAMPRSRPRPPPSRTAMFWRGSGSWSRCPPGCRRGTSSPGRPTPQNTTVQLTAGRSRASSTTTGAPASSTTPAQETASRGPMPTSVAYPLPAERLASSLPTG